MSFKLNFSGLGAASARFAAKAKSEKAAAAKPNHPMSMLTGQTTTDNLVATTTRVERQIFGPRAQPQNAAVVPQEETLPQAGAPTSFSVMVPQFTAQAPVSGYGSQYSGQPPGGTTDDQNEVEPQNNSVSLDGSDRKFYIRSPEPGALQRFDEQYALQLTAQEAEVADEAYAAEVEHVREVAAQGDNVATAQAVEQAAEVYADDPEVVDQLIEDLQPEIAQASAGLDTKDYGKEEALATVTSFGRVAELASADGAQALAQIVVEENDLNTEDNSSELWYLDDAINKVPQGGGITFGLALADELELHGRVNAAKDVRRDVIDNLDSLTEYVEDSAEDREELDEQLTESLSSFQGLSQQEVADYISIYQQENLEAYSAEVDSAGRLNDVLARNGDALDQMVADHVAVSTYGRGYPLADNLVDAYATLAESSLPALALEWAVKPQSEEITAAFASTRIDIQETVVEPALAGTLLQYQSEEDDPNVALDRFEALFTNLEFGKSILSTTSDLSDIEIRANYVADALQTIEEMRDLFRPGGPERYLEALEKRVSDIDELTPFDAAFEVAGLTFAIVNFGEAEGFVENATAAVSVSSGGLDLLSKGIDTLNKKGRLAFLGDDGVRHAARFSKFGARMVPYINIGLNMAATIASGREFAGDPSMGRLLAVVGDGLSLIGAAVGVFGVTKPLAALLEFTGLALAEIGTYWAEAGERNEINDDEERILTAVFEHRYPELKEEIGEEAFGEAVRQLADASDPSPAAVFERAGLDTEQLLRLFGTVPGSNNREGRRLLDFTEAHNLTGDDFVEFAQAMDEAGVINGYDIAYLDGAELLGWTPDQALAALEQLGEHGAYTLASRYLDFAILTNGRNAGHLAVMYEGAGVDFDALGIDIEDYHEGDG